MKKVMMLAAVAVFAFGLKSNAQSSLPEFGIKGGLNISNYSGSYYANEKAKVGFDIGLTVDYGLAPDLNLMSGLEYTTKGVKYGYNQNSASNTENIGYLQVPIHLGYKLSIAPGTRLVLHGGPYLAYAVNGSDHEGGASYNLFDDETSSANQPNRFDAGLGLGVGLEFGKLGFNLGYDFGLTNLNKNDNSSYQNMNTTLSVSYRF